MKDYNSVRYLLGESDVSLNENKQYKVTKKLDDVIASLKDIIATSPLEECEDVDVMDKLLEINSLVNAIRDVDSLEEAFDINTVGAIGAIVAGVGSMVGLMGVKAFMNNFETNGKIVPTKISNLMHDIKVFVNGDPAKREKLEKEIRARVPSISQKALDIMVNAAIKKESKETKKKKPLDFEEYNRLKNIYGKDKKLGAGDVK